MPFDLRFKSSFNLLLIGPTRSGKTSWVKNLLTFGEYLFTDPPVKVFLFYKMMQDMYLEMKENSLVHELVDVSKQMPTLDDIKEMVEPYTDNGGSMIIFDDCMSDINNDFENLFCNLSHHMNCSIIFLTQNLFYQDNVFRTMARNTTYMVLMKNERDKLQSTILGKQYSPGNHMFIPQVLREATKHPYGYLILDFSPETAPAVKVLSHIFPHEFPTRAYLETKQ
jgi:hypothetical protein